MAKTPLTPEEKRERRIQLFEERLKCLTMRSAKNEVAKYFQAVVRLRAVEADGMIQCVLCGARHAVKTNKMDAGHYYSRAHSATLFDFRNCHPCCARCNNHKGGNMAAYKQWMESKYSAEELAELHAKHLEPKEWTRRELAELKFEFKAEIKRLERGDGE